MQQFELTHEFLSQLEELIDAGNKTEVSKQIAGLHPADIAEILEELNNERAQFVFLLLDNEKAGDVLAEIDEEERVHFIESFPAETIARRFIDNMDSDDAADLVASMPNEQQHEVLSHMEDLEQAGDIVDLLHYDEDTAGGLMAKELVMVNENWTVLTCLREVSRQAENLDEIYNIYVVDDDNKLKGRLSLKKIITAPTSAKISNLYYPDIISVKTDEPAESVALIMQKYDLVAIPVIDQVGRLVGRITIDDVVDFIREEADKDYQMMSGISQDVESSDSIWAQTKARLPWLIIALFGGMVSAWMIYSGHHCHGRECRYTVVCHRRKRLGFQFIEPETWLSEYRKRNRRSSDQCHDLFLYHILADFVFRDANSGHAHHGNAIAFCRYSLRIYFRYGLPAFIKPDENRSGLSDRSVYYSDQRYHRSEHLSDHRPPDFNRTRIVLFSA